MKAFRLRFGRGPRRRGTRRRPLRFKAMLSNRVLWPSMIGVALAVGIGVQMGESAIGAINPIHFQGAAPPVQAIDPDQLPPPMQPSFAQAYGWAQGEAARQADGATPYEDFDYVPRPMVQQAAAPLPPPPAPIRLAPWPPGQVSAHPDVERFTDFPIEAKPAAQAAPEPEPEPEAAPPAETDKPSQPQ
jgi:hypothetical protein